MSGSFAMAMDALDRAQDRPLRGSAARSSASSRSRGPRSRRSAKCSAARRWRRATGMRRGSTSCSSIWARARAGTRCARGRARTRHPRAGRDRWSAFAVAARRAGQLGLRLPAGRRAAPLRSHRPLLRAPVSSMTTDAAGGTRGRRRQPARAPAGLSRSAATDAARQRPLAQAHPPGFRDGACAARHLGGRCAPGDPGACLRAGAVDDGGRGGHHRRSVVFRRRRGGSRSTNDRDTRAAVCFRRSRRSPTPLSTTTTSSTPADARRHVPRCAGDDRGRHPPRRRAGDLELVASTSEASRFVETMQLSAEAGPCIESFRTGRPCRSRTIADAPVDGRGFREARSRRDSGRSRRCRCGYATRRSAP